MSCDLNRQPSLSRRHTVLLFLPCLLLWLWMFVVRYGTASIDIHGDMFYQLIRYFMDNLTRGVFPMWDPMGSWGVVDEIDQRFFGEYNPFLWIYSLLTFLGIPRLWAFLGYALFYFLTGAAGVYFLTKRLTGEDRLPALAAALLYMFASPVFSVFTNLEIHLLLVPVIWFFYYLISFGQEPRRHSFLGLVFSLAVIAVTYMPFYFLAVLTPFCVGVVFLYFRRVTGVLRRVYRFWLQNKRLVIAGFVFLALALGPGVHWFLGASRGEVNIPWRIQSQNDTNIASMDNVLPSEIAQVMSLKGLFSRLDRREHIAFFMPFFIYILLLLSIINRLNRLQIILMIMGAWIFFHFLGNLAPVHPFLHKHLYVYRLFRNLNYFIDFLVPVAVVFFAEQLRLLLSAVTPSPRARARRIRWVIVSHATLGGYLFYLGGIFAVTWLTLILSAVFFSLYYSGILAGRRAMTAFFVAALIVMQPVVFFNHHPGAVTQNIHHERFVPVFSYLRPPYREGIYMKGKIAGPVQDVSGFETWRSPRLRWSQVLMDNAPRAVLEPYTRHKFVVYDNVVPADPDKIDFGLFRRSLAEKQNAAWVFLKRNAPLSKNPPPGGTPGTAEFITAGSDRLKVTAFDLNAITLTSDFPSRKFLVYNDSYHPGWSASVNGRPARIYQSNIAFKGIWLPAGKNVVQFSFGRGWEYVYCFALLALFYFVFLCLVWLTLKPYIKTGRRS